eukprot:3406264-Prymnesium_polylepis.1
MPEPCSRSSMPRKVSSSDWSFRHSTISDPIADMRCLSSPPGRLRHHGRLLLGGHPGRQGLVVPDPAVLGH